VHSQIAKIESTHLGWEDHGIFTTYLIVSYGGSGQSIGGYSLDEPRRDGQGKHIGRFGTAYGAEWIARTMRACSVDRWEDIAGRTVLVYKQDDSWNSPVLGIGPLPTERGETFIFEELAAEFGVDSLSA
jgi:hypothetical protein